MGPAQSLDNVIRGEDAVGRVERTHRYAADSGSPSALVEHDVGTPLHHHQVAGLGLGTDGDLVRHAARGHENRRLLSQELGRPLLEPIHGRIVTVDVVADLRRGHRLAHRVGRLRDGIAAQIDHDP